MGKNLIKSHLDLRNKNKASKRRLKHFLNDFLEFQTENLLPPQHPLVIALQGGVGGDSEF